MSYYTPDAWVVIFLNGNDPHYRVLVGWNGGYTQGTSWKLNSGITEVIEEEDYFLFIGSSGSTYACHKEMYGLRISTSYVWNSLKEKYGDKVSILSEDTNWSEIDWIIS